MGTTDACLPQLYAAVPSVSTQAEGCAGLTLTPFMAIHSYLLILNFLPPLPNSSDTPHFLFQVGVHVQPHLTGFQ